MPDRNDLKNLITDMTDGFMDFKKEYNEKFKELKNQQEKLELDLQQQGIGGTNTSTPAGSVNARVLNKKIMPFVRDGNDAEIKNAMQTGSGADGGYSVIPQMDNVIHTVERDLSPIYNDARKVVCNSSVHEMLMNVDLSTAAWTGERDSRDAVAGPSFKLIETHLAEQSCLIEVTQRLIDDSAFNIESFLQDNVATSFALAAGTAFITGNGIERPMGILSYDTSTDDDDDRDWKKIQYVPSGASGGFLSANSGSADVLFTTVYKMRSGYLSGAKWYMNRSTAATVRTLKDENGNFLWQDNFLQANQPPLLVGYPVQLCEDMEDIGADSYSIMFANLQRGYIIPQRAGMRYLRDPYTLKPYIRLFFTRRIGGGCCDFNAIKLVKFSTS
jgi:HK97 family phage major capsid protein